MPLPKIVLQTSDCVHFFYGDVLQTALGMGMGMNITAQVRGLCIPPFCPDLVWKQYNTLLLLLIIILIIIIILTIIIVVAMILMTTIMMSMTTLIMIQTLISCRRRALDPPANEIV